MGEALDTQLRECSVCKISKPLDCFHRRADGYQAWCKDCKRAYDAAYHARRRPLRLIQKRERKQGLVAWIRELKSSQPCTDCGRRFHPAAMTFDHLPGTTKRDDVSNLLYAGYRKLLLEEIAKCELVCANCHAIRTFLREEQARNRRRDAGLDSAYSTDYDLPARVLGL
jgi:hypothetical protein